MTLINILTYKLFESNSIDDIVQEMDDILLPLSDMGLNVSIVKLKSKYFQKAIGEWIDQPNWMDISLNISTVVKHYSEMNREFILGECYPDLIRLLNYMESIGFDNFIRFNIKGKGNIRFIFDDNNLIDENGDIFNNEAIGIIKINFMKR